MYINNNIKIDYSQVLKDVNKQGKEVDWVRLKLDSQELSKSYSRLEMESKADLTDECGSFLQFKNFLDGETLPKLFKSNFCKVRLCPMCASRRSKKIFGQVSKVMDHLEKNYNFRYLFLTLTVKNCYEEEFKETLDNMTKAFNKMNRRKVFKEVIKGYFRALEVTYNKIDNSYHPHFHIILAVEPNYFNDRKQYLSQRDWGNLWASCLGTDYIPRVDIRAVKKNNKKEVAEVAKYTVKSGDFLIRENGEINEEITDRVVKTLDLGLHRKRLVAFGFIFKEIHNKLNLDDPEDGRLEDSDIEEDGVEGLNYVLVNYVFDKARRDYFKLN